MRNIAFFDTKPYDRIYFDQHNDSQEFSIRYFENKLGRETAILARDCEGVIAFVNDEIDAQTFQLAGHLDFFAEIHAAARALLPVPQRGVENFDSSVHAAITFHSSFWGVRNSDMEQPIQRCKSKRKTKKPPSRKRRGLESSRGTTLVG